MASQSQSTCEAVRSRVRSSSNWRCGRWRWQKNRSCKDCACEPARVSHVVMVACRKPKTRSAAEASSPRAESREHHGDLVRRGFQPVEGGVTPRTERGTASRTSEGLDPLGLAMFAISDQRMDVSIGDPEVRTLSVGTSEAFGGYPLGCSPLVFHLAPGTYWCRGRFHTRRGDAGEATSWAVKRGSWSEEALGCGVDGPSS